MCWEGPGQAEESLLSPTLLHWALGGTGLLQVMSRSSLQYQLRGLSPQLSFLRVREGDAEAPSQDWGSRPLLPSEHPFLLA